MTRLKSIGILGIILLSVISGCIPSLHPLYTDKDCVTMPGLEGVWEEEGTIWNFKMDTSSNIPYYQLTIWDDSVNQNFELHAVKLGKTLFFDFFPENPESKLMDGTFYGMHFVPAHTFAVVDEIGDSLVLRMPDPDHLEKLFKEGKIRLKHENPEELGIILTASTQELQKFVTKYADDDELFSADTILKKKRTN